MLELDYAYLADYAQIENGKISALGASYTHAVVQEVPSNWLTTVTGRVRADQDTEVVGLSVVVRPPEDAFTLRYEGTLERSANFRPYKGKIGLLFTITLQIPLTTLGLYRIDLFLEGELARTLAFSVEIGREP